MDALPMGSRPVAMEIYATEVGGIEKRAGVTEETVGDPYSFGRDKTYLGVVQTRRVALRDDCTGVPPEAGPCIELEPAPLATNVEEFDLGSIELPGRSTNSILCFTITPFAQWEWYNDTGTQQTADMFLRPYVKIESDVLDDPALINPNTGLPFDGVLLESTVSVALQSRTIDPNERDLQYRSFTRSCTGGLINIPALRDGYGLSERLIRDLFRNPITVTFGVVGHVSMVDWASYSVGIRLYGD
jgi:hypothetical protein